jgi:hypothetical protein
LLLALAREACATVQPSAQQGCWEHIVDLGVEAVPRPAP